MKLFLKQFAITAVAILLASFVSKIQVVTLQGLLLATLILTLLNIFVRPWLLRLALPLLILTLGLFLLIINALLLYWVGHLSILQNQFEVPSFGTAVWGSFVISIATIFLNAVTGTTKAAIRFQRRQPPPRPPSDDDGPIIDV